MTATQRLILILAGAWIVVKLILFYTGNALNLSQLAISLNIGFLIYIIYVALKNHYKSIQVNLAGEVENVEAQSIYQHTDFIKDFKVTMKAAMQYSLVIIGFLAIYYIAIDTGYMENLVDDRMELLKEQMDAEGGYEAMLEKYKEQIQLEEGAEPMTEEEYFTDTRSNFISMFQPKILLPLLFIYFFLLSLACSAIISGIGKKIIPVAK